MKRKTIISYMGRALVLCFAWPTGFALLISALLHFGGDFPDIYSYAQPRLGAAFAVMLIVSFGLFSVFSKDYLKRILRWAVILPLLWAGIFTWAYRFASLPEKNIWEITTCWEHCSFLCLMCIRSGLRNAAAMYARLYRSCTALSIFSCCYFR